ncbi:MAG: hypothetical protein F6K35_36215 [Okeania sp. SIO2H7]|nr:hypothetical protein [Okeania sp. SIO2H7]
MRATAKQSQKAYFGSSCVSPDLVSIQCLKIYQKSLSSLVERDFFNLLLGGYLGDAPGDLKKPGFLEKPGFWRARQSLRRWSRERDRLSSTHPLHPVHCVANPFPKI